MVASLVSTGCLWVLVQRAWPTALGGRTGMGTWTVSAFAIGLLLSSLAASPDLRRQRAGGLVPLLGFGAILGVGLGSVLPGILFRLHELERSPPLAELHLLLGELGALYGPLLVVLCALPMPAVVDALCSRGWRPRAAALTSSALVLALGAGLLLRAQAWERFLALPPTASAGEAVEALGSAWPWLVPCLALGLVAAASLAWSRRRAAALACLASLVVLADPVAPCAERLYALPEAHGSLATTLGAGQGSSYPLLDLTGPHPRYDGRPWRDDLAAALGANGFWDQGAEFLLSKQPADPWNLQLQRAVQLLPPPEATCGELAGTMATLRRYGVSVWLWPGISPLAPQGPLAAAHRHPVVLTLTYPPDGDACGVLQLDGDTAWLSTRPERTVAVPGGLDGLPELTGPCPGALIVAPTAATPSAALFGVLDRLAGTHPEAPFVRRIALRWPGLDPSVDDG